MAPDHSNPARVVHNGGVDKIEIDESESTGRYHYAMAGAGISFVAFAALGIVFSRIAGSSELGWGFALGVGAFVGLFAGVGFGFIAGNAIYQAKYSHH